MAPVTIPRAVGNYARKDYESHFNVSKIDQVLNMRNRTFIIIPIFIYPADVTMDLQPTKNVGRKSSWWRKTYKAVSFSTIGLTARMPSRVQSGATKDGWFALRPRLCSSFHTSPFHICHHKTGVNKYATNATLNITVLAR